MRAGLAFLALALAGCEAGPPPAASSQPPQVATLVPAPEAIRTAYLPTLDPHTMVEAEVRRVLAAGSRCAFRYTDGGKPVAAFVPGATGVLKLNGSLVQVSAQGATPDGGVLAAQGLRVVLAPEPRQAGAPGNESREADMRFLVQGGLEVGYRGFFGCS